MKEKKESPLRGPNHRKCTKILNQKAIVFKAFHEQKTMLMVSIETGILRANICRYVAKWQKSNSIHLLKHGFCNVSKHRAGYYTPDTNLFTQPLNLF
jgi:hypothetical protein